MVRSADVKSLANGRWADILAYFGVDSARLNRRHHPCPVCGGKDRFRFTDHGGNGLWICNQCRPESADGFELLMAIHRWKFRETLDRVNTYLNGGSVESFATIHAPVAPRRLQRVKQTDELQAKINKLWQATTVVTSGDPVDLYLRSRGIELSQYPPDIRLHPACEYWHTVNEKPALLGTYPALCGAVRNLSGELVNVRRIYLTPEGRKADVPSVKKLMECATEGALKGAATRLGEPEKILCISEGIENGLAVMAAIGVPVWAAGSAWSLAEIEVPLTIQELWVAADNDTHGKGLAAAKKLAERMTAQGITTLISLPETPSLDWSDIAAGVE